MTVSLGGQALSNNQLITFLSDAVHRGDLSHAANLVSRVANMRSMLPDWKGDMERMPRESGNSRVPQSAPVQHIGTGPAYMMPDSRLAECMRKRGIPMVTGKRARLMPEPDRGFIGPMGCMKFFDQDPTFGAIVSSSGGVVHVDIITQGVAVNQRVSSTWRNESAYLTGFIFNSPTAAQTTITRIMLVWDRQPNGAAAAVTDIFEAVAPSGVARFYRRENLSRFRILYDRMFVCNGLVTGTASQRPLSVIREIVNFPPNMFAQTETSDATGAIGNRISGALLAVAVSDQLIATAPTLQLSIRLEFEDDT